MKKHLSGRMACPDCGRTVGPRDVNLDMALAKCDACNGVFRFRYAKKWLPPARGVPRPDSIDVDRWGPELMVAYRWRTPLVVGHAVFCLIWNLVANTAFFSLLLGWQKGETQLFGLALAGIIAAMGWLMAYNLLATLVNHTYLRVTSSELLVGSGPVYWGGVRRVETDDVEAFFCTRGEAAAFSAGRDNQCYGLYALMSDGRLEPVMRNLTQADEARYLARVLSKHMGLKEATT